jgi:predicted DNA-binding protein with PD1-like motif
MGTIALRLSPGADLKGELLTLAARERVQAGWVFPAATLGKSLGVL